MTADDNYDCGVSYSCIFLGPKIVKSGTQIWSLCLFIKKIFHDFSSL